MKKRKYIKPLIKQVNPTFMDKYGGSVKDFRIRKEIDGYPVEELTKKYGSPLFVFSEKDIEEKYKELITAFKSRYPKFKLGWSYKTNYLNEICKIYHKLGSIAEVVSEFEYEKARKLGIDGQDIIFNGPYKPKEALKTAVLEGAKIHIDHWYEINDLEEIAKELDINIPVAIRTNMDIGVYPQWNRFGFNIDNGEAYAAIKRIYEGKRLYLTGLHTHIGTFMLSPEPYKVAAEEIMKLKNLIEKDFGYKIEYIDLGGGFASKNRLKGVYQPPEIIVPNIEEYAEAITTGIMENLEGKEPPLLYLETGRHLIDEAGYLLTTVWAEKLLPNGVKSYIVDAGINLLYTAFWYNFKIEINNKKDSFLYPSIINGPLCMNIDVLAENIELPPLDRGDILTLSPVGAYSVTQWMQFIRYRPSVILIRKDGKIDLIRRSEKLEDITTPEIDTKF